MNVSAVELNGCLFIFHIAVMVTIIIMIIATRTNGKNGNEAIE